MMVQIHGDKRAELLANVIPAAYVRASSSEPYLQQGMLAIAGKILLAEGDGSWNIPAVYSTKSWFQPLTLEVLLMCLITKLTHSFGPSGV